MLPTANSQLSQVFEKREQEITDQWMEQQQASGRKLTAAEREQANRLSREFVRALKSALQRNISGDISGADWAAVREFLVDLSSRRAKDGYTPRETASFVFSLKQPLFSALKNEIGSDPKALADEVWLATVLIDELGLLTTESYQKTREEVITRQQKELLELPRL